MNAALHASAAVVVRRTIPATAEVLFDAFLDPIALSDWMRPGSIRSAVATVEPWVGGRYEVVMQADSGPIPHTGVYRLIDRPRRLVFTWHSPSTGQNETVVTVDFIAAASGTEVVVTHELLPEAALPSHSRGWTHGLEHLDETCTRGRG
jgi:uncharacterized protein YndB with AHSA1/START domain